MYEIEWIKYEKEWIRELIKNNNSLLFCDGQILMGHLEKVSEQTLVGRRE